MPVLGHNRIPVYFMDTEEQMRLHEAIRNNREASWAGRKLFSATKSRSIAGEKKFLCMTRDEKLKLINEIGINLED